MPSKSSGKYKKTRQPKASSRQVGRIASNFRRLNNRHKKPRTKNRNSAKNGEIDKQLPLKNSFFVLLFSVFPASILWMLQAPKELVYVLLAIPTFLIAAYLIPLKTRYTKVVYGFLILMVVTILVTVLCFDRQSVLDALKPMIQIISK
ncbi:hypothetical protein [Microcoleus sp. herbarium14]|uniref:hypothetical protein n=1 Tax=Microcoleus sp. herbarium14 TaxID=3055439 RepID=UPI002FD6DB53